MQALRALRWSIIAMSIVTFFTFVLGLMVVLLVSLTLRDEPSAGVVVGVVGFATLCAVISTYLVVSPLRHALQVLPPELLPAAALGVIIVFTIVVRPVQEVVSDPGSLVRPTEVDDR
ncbi:MAG: hypothetical protein IT456_00980 [Planctomycetes bacterium]|nr:hypothetical protein [Planctomycetota bacterium]